MPSIASMSVPRKAYAPIRLLAELEDAELEALNSALTVKSDGVASPRMLANSVNALGDPFTEAASNDLVSMLFNLAALHFTHGWGVVDIAQVVQNYPDLELPDDRKVALGERLATLLVLPQVAGLAKAISLAYEHPATFHTARILSDLRPVFGDEPGADPLGAVITHTLRLDYFARNHHEEIFVTLDETDLRELGEAVERAKRKHETVRRLIERSGLAELETSFD